MTNFSTPSTASVIKDDFFATHKWFVVLKDGYKVNTVGYKTKKAAIADVEAVGWTVDNKIIKKGK
tara:strand:+ start:245 stop:439 length:195 start_codon:yes stop_codon:yes gene_type:complete